MVSASPYEMPYALRLAAARASSGPSAGEEHGFRWRAFEHGYIEVTFPDGTWARESLDVLGPDPWTEIQSRE